MIELDVSSAIAARALDGLYARQMVIANNIANANSPGFLPTRVDFEGALREAAASLTGDREADLGRVHSTPLHLSSVNQVGVRLDTEMTYSAENVMHYSMLLGMLDRKLQLVSMAINEGRTR
jgi:flagellar basal-body rod protein FlgB